MDITSASSSNTNEKTGKDVYTVPYPSYKNPLYIGMVTK